MTKFKEYYEKMVSDNKALFDEFKALHAKYDKDSDNYQEEFNALGERVRLVAKDYENKLCLQSEKAGYGGYTSSLSEKFQAEIKKNFPLYDHIGIIVKKFTIKKISF